jgi:D-alanyl-D-alanine carboxypeptidase
MRKILNHILIIFIFFLPSTLFASYQDVEKELPKILNHFIEQYHIPGVVLSIKFPNQPAKTFVAGYADLTNKQPMSANTYFLIASITKTVTSAIILQLQQEGKLKLSDSLKQVARKNSQLKSIIIKYPRLQNITVNQLLNHTSGLPEVLTSPGYMHAFQENAKLHWNETQLIELAMQEKFGKPGEFNYTNTDYILAGLVIESVTAKPLADSVQQVLHQANISDAYFFTPNVPQPSSSILNQLSQAYMPENPYWPPLVMQVIRQYPKVYVNGDHNQLVYNVTPLELSQLSVAPAAGGLIMRVPDLVQWFNYLFAQKTILNTDSLNQMLTTIKTNKNSGYGLGIAVDRLPVSHMTVYYHTGSDFGYNTNLIYIKNSGIIIAAAINAQRDTLHFNEGLVASVMRYLVSNENAYLPHRGK